MITYRKAVLLIRKNLRKFAVTFWKKWKMRLQKKTELFKKIILQNV